MKSWMLDFYLRRLPTPESIRQSWLFALFGPFLMRADYWVPSRHSLALGIGLGWFIGLLPTFGFHIALGLLAGVPLRCHLPAVVFGTFISNPFTVPAILWLQYLFGRWICDHPSIGFSEASFFARHVIPLLAGGLVSAIVAGFMGYAGVWVLLGWKEKKIIEGVV